MRLSPLSVPYRVVERGTSIVFPLLFVALSGAAFIPGGFGPFAFVGLAGLVVVLLVGYEVAYYQRFEYVLTEDTLDIESGVLSRRNREIPLRRIQNVDIHRNVVQRVLGIAAVDLETAGGSDTEGSIRYVSFEEAKRLQRDIGRLKRGGDASESTPATEPLFALDDRELALVGALSFDLRLPGLLFVLVPTLGSVVGPFLPTSAGTVVAIATGVMLFVAVVLVSWVVGATVTVLNYYGFKLDRIGDELTYERGLLRRYDGSIPFDKIQTLTIQDNPLKRYVGYATLAIETAGYGTSGGPNRSGSEAAVPLATTDRVLALAREIEAFGDPEFERPPKRVRRRYAARYLIALGVVVAGLFGLETVARAGLPWYAPAAFVPVIPVAAHYKWKHRGYWLGPEHVVTRNGVLSRETKIVPYYRIQTVIDSRTVFQRRWRLATVTVDTAGSLSLMNQDAAAVDVDVETANRLRSALDERLRASLVERRQERIRLRQERLADGTESDSVTVAEATRDVDSDASETDAESTARTDEHSSVGTESTQSGGHHSEGPPDG
ncbi:MAG: PH domain-containing protein [Halobacteriota archaeon]